MIRQKVLHYLVICSTNMYIKDKLIYKYYNLNSMTEKEAVNRFNATRLEGVVGKYDATLALKLVKAICKQLIVKEQSSL